MFNVKLSHVHGSAILPSGNITDFVNALDNILCVLQSTPASLMILGDVNIDTISYISQAKEFRNLLKKRACNNVISLPARVTLNTATSLDVCITNVDKNNISHHLPIFFSWDLLLKWIV